MSAKKSGQIWRSNFLSMDISSVNPLNLTSSERHLLIVPLLWQSSSKLSLILSVKTSLVVIIRLVWPKAEFLLHLDIQADVLVQRSGAYVCNVAVCLALVSMQTCCDPRPLTHMAFCCRDSGKRQRAKRLQKSWRRVSRVSLSLYFPLDCLFCHDSFECDKWSSCKLLFLVIYANVDCSHTGKYLYFFYTSNCTGTVGWLYNKFATAWMTQLFFSVDYMSVQLIYCLNGQKWFSEAFVWGL